MTAKTTNDPKGATTAAHIADHGCCGGATAVKPRSKHVDDERDVRAKPAEPTKSSCCCGTKNSRPAT